MNLAQYELTFQEIPDEICLTLLISGCKKACKGCHSQYAWNENFGDALTPHRLHQMIDRFHAAVTCVVFLGGEWHKDELIRLLRICRERGLSTALYTGEDDIDTQIKSELTYLKTGRWVAEKGGLNSATTNQRLIHLELNKILLPLPMEGQRDSTTSESNRQEDSIHQ